MKTVDEWAVVSSRSRPAPPSRGILSAWLNALVLLVLLTLAAISGILQAPASAADWPGAMRVAIALLLLACWLGWTWRTLRRAGSALPSANAERNDVLIIHASQTGTATEIASRSAESLSRTGLKIAICDIAKLDANALSAAHRLLWVLATTGDGEPPDVALRFSRSLMSTPRDLRRHSYAILALGDRSYQQFCAFGHAVERWLQSSSAKRLHPMIEVDAGDDQALSRWHAQLETLSGGGPLDATESPTFDIWTLAQRSVINPGSQGAAIHHLQLRPACSNTPAWPPGGIARIRIRQSDRQVQRWLDAAQAAGRKIDPALAAELRVRLRDCRFPELSSLSSEVDPALLNTLVALPARDFSIASIAADGCIELVIRETRNEVGELGLGSAWLCHEAALGERLDVHLRDNPHFRLPPDESPLILIGAGTGIAGLRALWRARHARRANNNWLIFGERHPSSDALFEHEVETQLAAFGFFRVDRAYSHTDQSVRYVQDVLQRQADLLDDWLALHAHIRVCGSAGTMGKSVDAELRRLLGDPKVDAMIQDGRYQRDVY